ncbi:MAG: glycosyltransferase, partial [Myxococcaceae bacterium]|nr:glycosyltransferase [Myxococcaceae bacterium]
MEARALHVVHLGKYYPPAAGGIERHVQTLARAQAALGAQVEVLCVNHADGSGRDVVRRAVARTPTEVCWDGPVRVVRVGRVASLRRFDLCPALLEQLQALRRHPPDVLHLHTPNATMLLALAALPPFSTHVVTHHSDVVTQQVLRHALRPFERLEYGRAARVLVTSEGNATGSRTLAPFREKLGVLHLGIELGLHLEPTEAVLGHARRWREETPG